jgi:VanZ family protein
MLGFSVRILHYQVLRGLSLALAALLIFLIFRMADSTLATGSLGLEPPLDKLLHAAVYGSMAGLLRLAGVVRRVPLLWLILVGVGVLDELQQMTIVGREASAADLLADMAGISVALWLSGWLCLRIKVLPPAKA